MIIRSKITILLIISSLVLSGCYNLTVRITDLPENTPAGEAIYITGNFNNWDPGDARYIMQLSNDSVYEVKLPKGIGRLEYKFTRGDWRRVEIQANGEDVDNRIFRGKAGDVVYIDIEGWRDR